MKKKIIKKIISRQKEVVGDENFNLIKDGSTTGGVIIKKGHVGMMVKTSFFSFFPRVGRNLLTNKKNCIMKISWTNEYSCLIILR